MLGEYEINISGFISNTKLKIILFRSVPELLSSNYDEEFSKKV